AGQRLSLLRTCARRAHHKKEATHFEWLLFSELFLSFPQFPGSDTLLPHKPHKPSPIYIF
ncbi:MAG: hypothetical protein Q4C91_09570, partial [Eubacteriales bacterium]|nr:hypothetical protein [Eubacteriales bacterium]